MPFFPLCLGFFSWYNKMYFSSCFSKFHLENLVFFSLHGLHCEKVKEAGCIFSQIPATETGRHWTLSEFQIYCITGKQRSCAVRSLKETKIWWWKGGWCNSWIRSPVHFQGYILLQWNWGSVFSFILCAFIHLFIHLSKAYWMPVSWHILCPREVYWPGHDLMKQQWLTDWWVTLWMWEGAVQWP